MVLSPGPGRKERPAANGWPIFVDHASFGERFLAGSTQKPKDPTILLDILPHIYTAPDTGADNVATFPIIWQLGKVIEAPKPGQTNGRCKG